MGRLRTLVVAGLVVALAALLLRGSCDDADDAPRATSAAPADQPSARQPQNAAPRTRARVQASSPDAAESGLDDSDTATDTAPADAETRLLVTVVDEDGATVPGATVRWGADDAPPETWREGQTDATGEARVVLTNWNLRILASHERGVGASASTWALSLFAGSAPKTRIVLHRPVTIRGVVVDTIGSAVPGAVVDMRLPWVRPVETGADGRFEFPPVPAATLRPPVSVTAAGYAATEASVREGASGPEPLRVVLRWLVTLRMRFVDEAGAPVAGVLIERSGSLMIPHLEDGRLVLRGEPSPGSFRVSAEEPHSAYVAWTGPGPEIDLGDVRLARLRPTRIAFAWSDGAAVSDVSVSSLVHAGMPFLTVFDAATSTAELQLGAGTWPVVFRATRPARDDPAVPLGTRDLAVVSLELRAGEDRRVTLVPAPILVVRAKDAAGAPFTFPSNVRVLIAEDRTFSVATEADRLAVPLPGEFPMRITLEVPGSVPVSVEIATAPGPLIEREVVLTPAKK